MSNPTVTVPEDHKVVVVPLAPQISFGPTVSGVWVADTGPQAAGPQLIGAVAEQIAADPQAQVILVVQPTALARELAEPPAMVAWLQVLATAYVPDARPPIVVVPRAQPGGLHLALLINSLGLPVHDAAPDGAVFVEVHAPEGIRTGLPGPALTRVPETTLAEIGRARRLAGEDMARLRELEARELRFVTQLLADDQPLMTLLARLDLPTLVSLAASDRSTDHIVTILDLLPSSKVGGRAPTTPGARPELPLVDLDNGERALVCLCDIPTLAQANPTERYFELSGADVLAMAGPAGLGIVLQAHSDYVILFPKDVALLFRWMEDHADSTPTRSDSAGQAQAQLDTEWQQEQRHYLVKGRDGKLHPPRREQIMWNQVFAIIFGLVLLALTPLLLGAATFGLARSLAMVVPLVGIGWIVYGAISGRHAFANLKAYQSAYAAYQERRQALMRSTGR